MEAQIHFWSITTKVINHFKQYNSACNWKEQLSNFEYMYANIAAIAYTCNKYIHICTFNGSFRSSNKNHIKSFSHKVDFYGNIHSNRNRKQARTRTKKRIHSHLRRLFGKTSPENPRRDFSAFPRAWMISHAVFYLSFILQIPRSILRCTNVQFFSPTP